MEAKLDNLRNESKSRDRMRLEANKRLKTVKKQKPLYLQKQEIFTEAELLQIQAVKDKERSRIEQQTIQYNDIIEHSRRYSQIKSHRIGEMFERRQGHNA